MFGRADECNVVPPGVLVHIQRFRLLNGLISVPEVCVQVETTSPAFAIKTKIPKIKLGPLTIGAAKRNICPLRERDPILCGGEQSVAPVDGPSFEMSYKAVLNPPFFDFKVFVSGSISMWDLDFDVCAIIGTDSVTMNSRLTFGPILFLALFSVEVTTAYGGAKVEMLAKIDSGSRATLAAVGKQVVEERRQKLQQELEDTKAALSEAQQDIAIARAEIKRQQDEKSAAINEIWDEIQQFMAEVRALKYECDSMSWWWFAAKAACYAGVKVLEVGLDIATTQAYGLIAAFTVVPLSIADRAMSVAKAGLETAALLVEGSTYAVDHFATVVTFILNQFDGYLDVRKFEFYLLVDTNLDVFNKGPRVRFKIDCIVFGAPVAAEFEAEVQCNRELAALEF